MALSTNLPSNGFNFPSPVLEPCAAGNCGSGSFETVSTSAGQNCGLQSDHSLWCWGDGWRNVNDSSWPDFPQGSGPLPLAASSITDPFWIVADSALAAGAGDSPLHFDTISLNSSTNGMCGLQWGSGPSGAIYCFGANSSGQLGNGTTNPSTDRFVQVDCTGANNLGTPCDNQGWTTLTTAGAAHYCALQSDSSLWCWGDNTYDQIGASGIANSHLPWQIDCAGSSGPDAPCDNFAWTSATAGANTTCGIQGHQLYCWGRNQYGQLGRDPQSGTDFSLTPIEIPGPAIGLGWNTLSIGKYNTCGIATDGSLWCWGDASFGQLGVAVETLNGANGTVNDVFENIAEVLADYIPQHISTLSGHSGEYWAEVAVGDRFVCGTDIDGNTATHACWGLNTDGQLGAGEFGSGYAPTPVEFPPAPSGPASITQIATGIFTTCAVGDNKNYYCWGANGTQGAVTAGMNGQDSNIDLPLHTPFNDPNNAFSVSESVDSISVGGNQVCVVSAANTSNPLWCWGDNTDGQLGVGDTLAHSSGPVAPQAPVSVNWSSVSAGYYYACALGSDADIYCWGDNEASDLGRASDSLGPSDLSTTTALSGGPWLAVSTSLGNNWHSCAIKDDSTIWCWGIGGDGALGDGNGADSQAPVMVTGPSGPNPNTWASLSSSGQQHVCALGTDHAAYCWGLNNVGQLGDGCGESQSNAPAPVSCTNGCQPTQWSSICTGDYFSCGIQSDHTLWCWGANGYEQMGRPHREGDPHNYLCAPTEVGSDSDWQSVACGGSSYACATKLDGKMYCWGNNDHGQLGNSFYLKTTPTPLVNDPAKL